MSAAINIGILATSLLGLVEAKMTRLNCSSDSSFVSRAFIVGGYYGLVTLGPVSIRDVYRRL